MTRTLDFNKLRIGNIISFEEAPGDYYKVIELKADGDFVFELMNPREAAKEIALLEKINGALRRSWHFGPN